MMFFRSGISSKKANQAPAGPPAQNPFLAIPVKNVLADAKADQKGNLQVRMRPQPEDKPLSRLTHRMGFHRDVRVDLDEHGTYFWGLVDGKNSLKQIERQMRNHFQLDIEESRKATLIFTKMLMVRHLIQLDLRGQSGGAASNKEEKVHV